METVPLEVLETTIMNMEPREILNLCETSTYYREAVCRNEKLWKQLLIRDFPQSIDWITQYGSWMLTYRAVYLYEQDVNRLVSDIVEKLRNTTLPNDVIYHSEEIRRLPLRFGLLLIKYFFYTFICLVICIGTVICIGRFTHNRWSIHKDDDHTEFGFLMMGIGSIIAAGFISIAALVLFTIPFVLIEGYYKSWRKEEIQKIVHRAV